MALLAGGGILATLGGASGITSVATGLKSLGELDPETLAKLAPSLEAVGRSFKVLMGGNEGFLSSLGTALGNLVKGDSGISKFAEGLKGFNSIDGTNINNIATGMSALRVSVGDDLAKQADGVKTFADSIKTLATNIQNLQSSLEKLNKTPGGPQATAAAGANPQGSSDGNVTTNASAEKLEKLNTLVTELVSVAKETRDFNKDQVDAIKDRGSAMGRK